MKLNDPTTWTGEVERRLNKRYPASTKMTIIRKNGKRHTINADNLSSLGCCIKSSGLQLRINEEIEVAFFIEISGVIKIHRREARVVWVRNGKTGLSLNSFNQR